MCTRRHHVKPASLQWPLKTRQSRLFFFFFFLLGAGVFDKTFFFASRFSFTCWLCTSVNLCKVVGVCDVRQRAGLELSWKSLHRWHCFCFFRSHKRNNFDGGLQREGEASNFSFCGRAGSGKNKKTRPGSRPAVSGPQRSLCFDASRVFVRERKLAASSPN